MNLKQLLEERARLAKEVRRLADLANTLNRADFDREHGEAWTRCNADYDECNAKIERLQRAETIEGTLSRAEERERDALNRSSLAGGAPRPDTPPRAEVTEEVRVALFNVWVRAQMDIDLTEAQEAVCREYRFDPRRRIFRAESPNTAQSRALQHAAQSCHPTRMGERLLESRALSDYTGGSGAYLTAPASMVRRLEVNMLAYGGMLGTSEIMTTATGEAINWPTADDTSNKGVRLSESASIGSSTDPTFGRVVWYAYKYSSKPVLVPYELLEDSVFDVSGLLGDMFGERFGRILNDEFTTGTGNAMPKGIITAAGSFSAASATAIAADDLLGLYHAVDPAYRQGGGFMMHDSIVLALRKLKDGEGNYLWQSGLANNAPDRLLGAPVAVNMSMDSTIASGKKTILFGQLSRYKARRVNGRRFYRLEERYRDNDQDGFIAFERWDGNLLTAGTAPVKYLAH